MKKIFCFNLIYPFSEFAVMYNENTLPSLQQFKSGRQNFCSYRIFCERFVQCVIGSSMFKNSCYKKGFMEYASVSDEAITFLILENNWDAWTAIGLAAKNNEKVPMKNCGQAQKYFDNKTGRGHSWNSKGKAEYNNYFDSISYDREKYGLSFDDDFIEALKLDTDDEMKKKIEKNKKLPITKKVIRCRRDYIPKADRGFMKNTDLTENENEIIERATNRTNI
jgi:hypothetical protein